MKKIIPHGFLLALLLISSPSAFALPAFPGAEGFGANSVGGRGGQVIKVTNLNDSGAGSFREAVTTAGSRIVVFEVSGIIDLETILELQNPFITIAGETSPGGILVTGKQVTLNTNDVIIRHMRFRVGSHRFTDSREGDSMAVLGQRWENNEAYNIIFDHCSVSWGADETMSVTGGILNMTIQWSIISEGLDFDAHSKGLYISGKYIFPNTISIHHNYMAHNDDRNPQMGSPSDVSTRIDGRNNISYNWNGRLSPNVRHNPEVNWVHNYAKPGPNSIADSYELIGSMDSEDPVRKQIYVYGNIGATRLSQSDPQWNVGLSYTSELLPEVWRRDTPWEAPLVETTEMSYEYALEILQTVGATKPVRDSVDVRVVNDFANGTGSIRDDVVYPDDFPVFATPAPPLDADNDGMADSWETANNLNPLLNDSAQDIDGDGYTNIEEYIHSLSSLVMPSPQNVTATKN